MEIVRIGIIGTGWPGQQHAIAMREVDGVELAACADLDDTRRAEFEKEFSPARAYGPYEEMLADPKVDAVMVCLPNALHFPASLAALEAGKHVFCEKPPTMNSSEMRVLEEEAGRRGLVYFFGRQFRFTPAMRTARALVASGKLGDIYHGKATWVRSRGIPTGLGNWFTEKALSGGGALIDIGVHALDSVWYLIGTPRPLAVDAKVFRNFAHLTQAPVFDVEDAAYALIRFETGALVQLETCWAGNLTDDVPVGPAWVGRESNNAVVYGTKGTVRLNPLTLFEDRAGELVSVPLETGDKTDRFVLQLRNFVAAIRGDEPAVNNAAQAVILMQMLDAIYASSELGREVPLAG